MIFFLLALIQRLYLSEISSLINKKDIRAVRNWCNKNFVTIHSDTSGYFVFESEFELAYEMPLINKLKAQHGENWEVVYEYYKNKTLHKLLATNTPPKSTVTRYLPMGNIAKGLNKKDDTHQ